MKKSYLFIAFVIALGLGVIAVERATQDVPIVFSNESIDEPDFYGTGLTMRNYNEAGMLKQSLTSAKAVHSPNTEQLTFEAPVAISTDDQGRPWKIASRSGVMNEKEDSVTFIGQVLIEPINPSNIDEQVLFETEKLHYLQKTQIAQTDEAVRITNPTTVITATGMTFDMAKQVMNLHQQVNTRHVPPPAP